MHQSVGKGSGHATVGQQGPRGQTYVQNNQHRSLDSRGAAEGQDEAHGAPDPEADEYERDQDQFLISHGGGGASLQVAPLTDGPVLGEGLVLSEGQGAKT